MSAVDQLLAEADALIEEWDGRSIDAATWTADGSHEIPDVAFVWCARCRTRPVDHADPLALWCSRCEGDLMPTQVTCRLAPAGWWCSRSAGHEGPCAARPLPSRSLLARLGRRLASRF